MRFFNPVVFLPVIAAVCLAGQACAHTSYVAPPHVSHSSAKARSVVTVLPYGTYAPNGAAGSAMAQDQAASYQAAPVPSDEERYKQATGKTLPARHGMIVVPATSGGDATYIWAN